MSNFPDEVDVKDSNGNHQQGEQFSEDGGAGDRLKDGDGAADRVLDYKPPSPKRKRKKKKGANLLMAVGAMLDHARVRFCTEDGEHEVEEDAAGRFQIGGAPLSFASWAELTRTSEPDIKRVEVMLPPQKHKKPESQFEAVSVGKLQVEKPETSKSAQNGNKRKRTAAEKDEGELSDSSTDNDSDSSSGSESGARARRRHHRAAVASSGGVSVAPGGGMELKQIFMKAYQHRLAVAQTLSLQQKMDLLSLIRVHSSISSILF